MDLKGGVISAVCVLGGVMILILSIARVTLEINARENDEDRLRNNPVNFVINRNDGTTEAISYNLPTASMLPSNPMYGFRRIRDYLWLLFTKGSIDKSKIALLIADKKMAESKDLINNNQTKLALETIQEALDQLKYAQGIIAAETPQTGEAKLIRTKIYEAGLAYAKILEPIGQTFDLDAGKYQQLVNDLDKWNEERTAENDPTAY